MTDRSRHIPEQIARALVEEARGRCCICRELVLEGSNRHEAIADVLERHHVIYFSAGGEHTLENLLVVDPNCHRLIHHRPEAYPIPALKAAKQRWREIGSRFPEQILYEGNAPCLGPQEPLRLAAYPFSFETYGLRYTIIAPDSLRASYFAAFLKRKIVDVIAAMDDNTGFLEADTFYLSRKNDTQAPISGTTLLRDIDLGDDSLVLNMHVNVVDRAEAGDTVQIQAVPGRPRGGERYEVTVSHTSPTPLHVTITVDGTDGYKLRKNGVTTDRRFSITVPGGEGGVRDSIVGEGEFGVLRLMLVFGERQDKREGSEQLDTLDEE